VSAPGHWQGRTVIVHSKWGAWKGVLATVSGACPRGCLWIRPTMPGRGWSQQPVPVSRDKVEFVPLRGLRLVDGGAP
jgi:hypothetical protein